MDTTSGSQHPHRELQPSLASTMWLQVLDLHVCSQGKISCKILDTLQEKGHFTCKILAPCKFLIRFCSLTKNCARNVKFIAQFLQEKGHIQCMFSAQNVQVLARYFSLGYYMLMYNIELHISTIHVAHSDKDQDPPPPHHMYSNAGTPVIGQAGMLHVRHT